MPSLALAAIAFAVVFQAPEQPVRDPALLAAIERFYETQEREDIEGYLALWSRTAQRPTVAQLEFVFESGDDTFSDLRLTRVHIDGDRARVRLEVRRVRTRPPPAPGAPPLTASSLMRVALDFEREGTEWKLVREGPAVDALAADLVDARTEAERDRLLELESDLVNVQLLAALARLGSTAAVRQEYPRSLAIFEELVRLAQRTGHRKDEGEALQNVGNALYFMRRFPEALAAYERRLALERERDDAAAAAAALSGIATIRYSLAEYTDALARYREALAIQERLDDVAGLAFTTLSIGHITYLQGDFTAAIASYARSLALNRSMSHADGESRALEGLGRVYTAQGDYAAAVEAFETVRRDPRMRSSRDRLGSVSQSLGDVHVRLGNLDLAREVYEDGRRHFEAREDLPNVGRILQDLALTELLAGRFLEAEALYKESAATCAAADDRRCSTRAVAGLGYAQYSQENFWGAVGSYRSAIAAFTALGRREDTARAEVGLAQALSAAGDRSGAIEAATRARAEAEALDNDDVLWRALEAEARALGRGGHTHRALASARAAAHVIARMRSAALDRPGTSVPADVSGALALVAMLQAETGDADGAFATTEQIRSAERRGKLAASERDISRGMTATDSDEERAHAAKVLTALAQLTREKELPRPDAARMEALQVSIAELTAGRRDWMDRLFARLPDLQTWRGLSEPPAAADAGRLLADGRSVLLSIVLDLDGVLAITIRKVEGRLDVEAGITAVPRREAVGIIAALQQPALLADAAAWREAARAVVALLPQSTLGPLAAASRVFVIPHDIFWRVPFGALPIGGDVLLDRASVVTAGSLDSLLRSLESRSDSAGELVAIGSPAISAERRDRLREVAPEWFLRAVADLDAEIAGDPQAGPAIRLTHAAATEAALRSAAARASVLHVAAPFRLNPGSPLYSAILLADPKPQDQAASGGADSAADTAAEDTGIRRRAADDGVLELRELFTVTWGAHVAVLSDADTLSVREAAAAADVLEWGWLAAGVPSLVVARWHAASRDAGRVLTRFHLELRRGRTPAEALRTAQLAVRSQAATSAPHHWAGWMVMGAW